MVRTIIHNWTGLSLGDTGADISIIPISILRKTKGSVVDCFKSICLANGKNVILNKESVLNVCIPNRGCFNVKFYVIDDTALNCPIIGFSDLLKFYPELNCLDDDLNISNMISNVYNVNEYDYDFLIRENFVNENYIHVATSIEDNDFVRDIIVKEFSEVFNNSETVKQALIEPYDIDKLPTTKVYQRPYRTSLANQKDIEFHTRKLIEDGFVKRSTSE